MSEAQFTLPKPKPSVAFWALLAVVCIGLVAMFLSAEYAFSKIVENRTQSVFAALLIEVGMIAEAFALIRGHNRLALLGLIASLVVSVTYNYIQASLIGQAHGLTNFWLIGVLAIGPIIALCSVALASGQEWRKFEQAIEHWEMSKQNFLADEIARQDYLRQQAETRKEQVELKKMRIQSESRPTQALPVFANDSPSVSDFPTKFSRGYAGFEEYLSALKAVGRPFIKRQAVMDMGVVERSIDRYIAIAREKGVAL